MKIDPVVIERTYNAPIERVWLALTEKDKMKQWYFDLKDFQSKVGFEFTFEGGSDEKTYVHLCRVTDAIPYKKIAYTWRYEGFEGNSHVTFELFPEGNQTRLKLTHEGLETFPQDIPDFAKKSFEAGWTEIIGKNLKEFLEKENVPA
jgi:uncharacterized protein YndB with AHSA1/START domain